jgi:probable phosphoglycerate mutase
VLLHHSVRQDGRVTLAFIRHGQTDWNRDGLLQGSSDIPLNDTGRQQAREAEGMLTQWTWDAIVSSPLARARETARIVAEDLGLPLGPAYPELAERDYGPLEGTPSAEAIERWPDRAYPGAESLDDVVARGLRGLARIDADYPGRNVVVVCHGTIMKYTLIRLTGYPVEVVLNGAVSTMERDGDGWRVLTVNGEPVA